MGRWAQRRLAGGGGPPTANVGPFSMVFASRSAPTIIIARYNSPVDISAMVETDFHTDLGSFGDTLSQLSPNEIEIDFVAAQTTATHLTYDGSDPQVITPQTIAIS